MHENTIEQTLFWLENMVIGLNLCPFAKKPYSLNRVRIINFKGLALSEFNTCIQNEIDFLLQTPISETETTLVVLENMFKTFEDFWEYASALEDTLQSSPLDEIFQIASFHPEYQFAGTNPDDLSNYSNRSPYPIIHILRQESITFAVENHPDPNSIPEHNIAMLQAMALKDILKRQRKENRN